MTYFSERRLCMFAGETPQRQPASNNPERMQEQMRTGHDVETTANMRRQNVDQLFQRQRTAGAKEATDPSRTVSFAPGQLLIRTRADGTEVRNSVQTTRFFDANGNPTITRIGGGPVHVPEQTSSAPQRTAYRPGTTPQFRAKTPIYETKERPQMADRLAPEPEPEGRADIHLTKPQRELFNRYYQDYQRASQGLQQQLLATKPRTTNTAVLAQWQLQVKAQLEPYKQQYMEKLRNDPAWAQSQKENPVYLNDNGYGAAWGASNFEQRSATPEEDRAIAEVLEKYEQAFISFNASLPRNVPQAALLGPLNAFKAQQCQILNAELASKGLQVRMNRGNYYDIRIGIDARTLQKPEFVTTVAPQAPVQPPPTSPEFSITTTPPSTQPFSLLKPIVDNIASFFKQKPQTQTDAPYDKLTGFKDPENERMRVLLSSKDPGTYGNFEDPLHSKYAEDFNKLDGDIQKLAPSNLNEMNTTVAGTLPGLRALDLFFQSAKKTGNMKEFLKRANDRLKVLGQTSVRLVEDNGKLNFSPTDRTEDDTVPEENNARIEK